MPFAVTRPAGRESPLVVEVPHASLVLDAESLAWLTAPAQWLARDADLYVDRLFADAPDAGATTLVARRSRYVCDLNRSEKALDALSAEEGSGRDAPHGLIWRQTTAGTPALLGPLPAREVARRVEAVYRPYYRALEELVREKRERFGFCLLLCAHSMPSRVRGAGPRAAEVVIGTQRGTTSSRPAVALVERLAKQRGWRVAHDDPYAGGFTTTHFGRPAEAQHAVQLELSRALYMNEATLALAPEGWEKTVAYCRELVSSLASLTP